MEELQAAASQAAGTILQNEKEASQKKLLQQTALIIVNYNTTDLTMSAVRSLLQQDAGISIIIVDNCSDDNAKELLEKAFSESSSVHLIFADKNYGYAVGNNIGIDYAGELGTIRFVGIMNPDVEVSPSTLAALAAALEEHDEIGLITAKTYFNGVDTTPNLCAWRTPKLANLLLFCTTPAFVWSRLLKKLHKDFNDQNYYGDEHYAGKDIAFVDVVQGCFFMSKLETMSSIGSFDKETFLYFEENILAAKIKNRQKINAVLTKEYIRHNHQIKEKN